MNPIIREINENTIEIADQDILLTAWKADGTQTQFPKVRYKGNKEQILSTLQAQISTGESAQIVLDALNSFISAE